MRFRRVCSVSLLLIIACGKPDGPPLPEPLIRVEPASATRLSADEMRRGLEQVRRDASADDLQRLVLRQGPLAEELLAGMGAGELLRSVASLPPHPDPVSLWRELRRMPRGAAFQQRLGMCVAAVDAWLAGGREGEVPREHLAWVATHTGALTMREALSAHSLRFDRDTGPDSLATRWQSLKENPPPVLLARAAGLDRDPERMPLGELLSAFLTATGPARRPLHHLLELSSPPDVASPRWIAETFRSRRAYVSWPYGDSEPRELSDAWIEALSGRAPGYEEREFRCHVAQLAFFDSHPEPVLLQTVARPTVSGGETVTIERSARYAVRPAPEGWGRTVRLRPPWWHPLPLVNTAPAEESLQTRFRTRFRVRSTPLGPALDVEELKSAIRVGDVSGPEASLNRGVTVEVGRVASSVRTLRWRGPRREVVVVTVLTLLPVKKGGPEKLTAADWRRVVAEIPDRETAAFEGAHADSMRGSRGQPSFDLRHAVERRRDRLGAALSPLLPFLKSRDLHAALVRCISRYEELRAARFVRNPHITGTWDLLQQADYLAFLEGEEEAVEPRLSSRDSRAWRTLLTAHSTEAVGQALNRLEASDRRLRGHEVPGHLLAAAARRLTAEGREVPTSIRERLRVVDPSVLLGGGAVVVLLAALLLFVSLRRESCFLPPALLVVLGIGLATLHVELDGRGLFVQPAGFFLATGGAWVLALRSRGTARLLAPAALASAGLGFALYQAGILARGAAEITPWAVVLSFAGVAFLAWALPGAPRGPSPVHRQLALLVAVVAALVCLIRPGALGEVGALAASVVLAGALLVVVLPLGKPAPAGRDATGWRATARRARTASILQLIPPPAALLFAVAALALADLLFHADRWSYPRDEQVFLRLWIPAAVAVLALVVAAVRSGRIRQT